MSKRRERIRIPSQPSTNVFLPEDSSPPISTVPGSPLFSNTPVSASPPSLSGFLSKPSKWFSRPSLIHKNSSPSPESHRVRTTSNVRRGAISGPSDPRPLVPANHFSPETTQVNSQISRSVLDLALTSNAKSSVTKNGDYGSLRHDSPTLMATSRKTWSRSVDDLSSLLNQHPVLTDPPLRDESLVLHTMQTKARIEAYRQNSGNTSLPFTSSQPTPFPPSNPADIQNNSVAFPQLQHSAPTSTTALPENPPPPRMRNRTMSSFVDIEHSRSFVAPSNALRFPGHSLVPSSTTKHDTPPASADPTSKRSSQIIQLSGFLNRHTGSNAHLAFRSAHTLNAVLSKGWKSYKAVLKGSKLYFYKPPSDRSPEIKELFPQGTTPVFSELLPQPNETIVEISEEPETSLAKKKEETRKRARIYRGRNSHPELSFAASGYPTKGTADALLHEAIFGTCFKGSNDSSIRKRFSYCMIMCLPRLMGKETFENEFIRYAAAYVNDADSHEQEQAQSFVSWLSGLYIALYKHAFDEGKWETFKSSINYADDPTLTSELIGPFAPQFGKSNDARYAFGDLTDGHFLNLDPSILAQSLAMFHLQSLPQTYSTSFSIDLLEYALDSDENTLSSRPFSSFFGCDEAPHWLSRFIVTQVLNPNGRSSDMSPDTLSASKTHLRSDLITHWIKVAEHCRSIGDRCTWKAIEAALCSRPIARLEKAWRRTSLTILRLFHSWAKDTDSSGQTVMSPWGGDILNQITHLWPRAKLELPGRDDAWDVEILLSIGDYVNSVQNRFRRSTFKLDPNEQDEAAVSLINIWRNVQSRVPSKFRTFEDFMSQSFAAEPRLKGLFEAHHWQQASNVAAVQSMLPLSFVEPLPALSLVDREPLHRSRKDAVDTSSARVNQARLSELFSMMSIPNGDQQLVDMTRNIADGTGLVIPLHDGDLLVEVPERSLDSSSRPSSIFESNLERRTSQVRVTNGNPERKTSMARRGSLPVLPQPDISTPLEPVPESSLRTVVKAGTLDRLVDVLLFGLQGIAVSVADDNGEAPLRGGKTRLLKLDHEAYQTSWWTMFRSFVTPYVLFELLRKRSISAISSMKTQRAVMEAISHWIEKGGGIYDAFNDSELSRAMHAFLNTPFVERDDKRNAEQWESLEVFRQQVAGVFVQRSRRPQSYAPLPSQSLLDAPHPVNYGSQPPSLDELDPETLVDNLDALAATAMRSVTLDDLIVTIDILETQSADRIGWFLNYEPALNSDEIEIQSIYSHIQENESSILLPHNQDSIYKLLPSSIRGLVRAHAVIRKYLLSRIVTPRLGLRIRQARMETLLRAIEVCRLRTTNPSSGMSMSQSPFRSFVETALVSAIVAPESRFFSMTWHYVALARGTTADSLESLLAKPMIQSISKQTRLTIDIGWLLERFLEVISMPNLIDSSMEGSTLVSLDKRRYLHDLASLSLSLRLSRPRKLQNVLDRSDTERLNNMHRQVTGPAFDSRLLRDEAYHESLNGSAHSKKNQRPFAKIVQLQQEKCKRDKVVREKLTRERKAEQIKSDKREEDLNRAMHSSRPNALALKNQRSRRTMSSAFLQLMRPISSAFTSGDQSDNGTPFQRRTAKELDFEPTGKPSLVISLAGATVKSFVNTVRLYLFYVTTEDGGRYLLQASTRSELESWVSGIAQTAKLTSAKRLTYIGNSTKPIIPHDQMELPSQMGSRHPQAVFNVELDILLQRESGGNSVGAVPQILERCFTEIEARGLQEPGLYRVPGASSAIAMLRTQFDTGQEITFFDRDYVDIFAICDVVKTWLRALPRAIFPEKSYHEALQVIQIQDFEARLKAVRKVIHELPVNSMYLLRRVCEHLDRVTDYEEQNQMTAEALAVIFNPSLLRPPTNNFGLLMQNMKYTSQLLQMLIIHFHRVFDEGDTEQDDEAEGDVTERIEDTAAHNANSGPSWSAPTDVIHDHDPDLELFPRRVEDEEIVIT